MMRAVPLLLCTFSARVAAQTPGHLRGANLATQQGINSSLASGSFTSGCHGGTVNPARVAFEGWCSAAQKCHGGGCPKPGKMMLRVEPCDEQISKLNTVWGGAHITISSQQPYDQDQARTNWDTLIKKLGSVTLTGKLSEDSFKTESSEDKQCEDAHAEWCGIVLRHTKATEAWKALNHIGTQAQGLFADPRTADFHMSITEHSHGCGDVLPPTLKSQLMATSWELVLLHIGEHGEVYRSHQHRL